MAGEQDEWAQCIEPDCIGVLVPNSRVCLVHAVRGAPDAFAAELQRIKAEGTIDARGVIISAELLEQLLGSAPLATRRPAFKAASFQRASFRGQTKLGSAERSSKVRPSSMGRRSKAWPRSVPLASKMRPASAARPSRAMPHSHGQPLRGKQSSPGRPSYARPASTKRPSIVGPGLSGPASNVLPNSGRCWPTSSSWTTRSLVRGCSLSSPRPGSSPDERSSRPVPTCGCASPQ